MKMFAVSISAFLFILQSGTVMGAYPCFRKTEVVTSNKENIVANGNANVISRQCAETTEIQKKICHRFNGKNLRLVSYGAKSENPKDVNDMLKRNCLFQLERVFGQDRVLCSNDMFTVAMKNHSYPHDANDMCDYEAISTHRKFSCLTAEKNGIIFGEELYSKFFPRVAIDWLGRYTRNTIKEATGKNADKLKLKEFSFVSYEKVQLQNNQLILSEGTGESQVIARFFSQWAVTRPMNDYSQCVFDLE